MYGLRCEIMSMTVSRRAQLKCRAPTGIYILQSNRTVFNQFTIDPTCKLCEQGPDTRQHFLAECQTLHHIRQNFYSRIQDNEKPGWDITSPDQLSQLINDPSVFHTSKTNIDLIDG